jgi:hypothetical protein
MGNQAKGFAVIDPAYQRKIASQGGKTAHALGKAHKFTSEEARAAGKKGQASRKAKNLLKEILNYPDIPEGTFDSLKGK